MSDVERLGIFGGTFNPPHVGHIHAAKSFLAEMNLDKLLIMPAGIPPHKVISSEDDPSLRLKMAGEAFAHISEKIRVSDYEILKSGISYTVDTLKNFSKPNRILYLLCGTDMFLSLDTWRSPKEIFSLAEIVCIPRFDSCVSEIKKKSDEYSTDFGAKCHVLNAPPIEISSSDIRNMIKQGQPTSEYLPESVRIIIESEKLYK